MKAAKIISSIAFVLNSLFSIFVTITYLQIRPVFQELQAQIPFHWAGFILPIFAIASLVYLLYLRNKEREGKGVKFAIWISIALLLIPLLFLFPAAIISIILTLYKLMPFDDLKGLWKQGFHFPLFGVKSEFRIDHLIPLLTSACSTKFASELYYL